MQLTNRATITALCKKYGFTLAKKYGQNFLVNPGICPKICDVAGVSENSNVLEIGPGFGTLTGQLALRAGKVLALEIDTRLLPVLNETLGEYKNVTVLHADVMKTDLNALFKEHFSGSAMACANLPYNITSPVIMKLLESNLPLTGVTVMVQKEAAERICAKPGTNAAGAISYAINYYAKPKLHFIVEPGSFMPPPKVQSAVISLTPHAHRRLEEEPEREKRMFKLIRAAFGKRRKTLANAVSSALSIPKQEIEAALKSLDIQPLARAEALTLEDFIAFEEKLTSSY